MSRFTRMPHLLLVSHFAMQLRLACLLLGIFCPLFSHATVSAKPTANDAQVVRIAYRTDSTPLQYLNDKGQADGILIDYWRTWSQTTGQAVEFVPGTNAEGQTWLAQNKVDLLAGVFQNEKRAKSMSFSAPLLHSEYFLFANAQEQDVEFIKQIANYSIGVTHNSFHHNWLKQYFPNADIRTFKGYQALFDAAINGEISLFICQPLYLDTYLKQTPSTTKFKPIESALYSHPYRAAVNKGNFQLLKSIDAGIQQIDNNKKRCYFSKVEWFSLGVSKFSRTVISDTANDFSN
ncbi:transporter substrate-binding domain-containing protein [Shewanella sp. UCD-KL21]|uniref:transporter substrate-binding domain-containing protein n=1 Tax=Shewanella sp. UCD-KL21 TaxID=1917164 RepID=UPI000970335E|nr:transporter substrate-binding domain-containing protein [Shewanella sp. UCD-KL21]